MRVYGGKVKKTVAPREPRMTTLRCVLRGDSGCAVPATVDTLLIAVLTVLTPARDSNERMPAATQTEQQAQQERRAAEGAKDPGACRYFVDPEARRKCEVRTSRAPSGAAEPSTSFPEGTIWLTPEEPRMPQRLPPGQY